LGQPAIDAEAITPHDSNEAVYHRAIYVGGAGDLKVVMLKDRTETAVTLAAVPVGTILPIRAKIILDTGTTATLLIALR
jgi:hypothetical protein